MADDDRDTTTANELPSDPTERQAAIEAELEDYRRQIDALTPAEGTMADSERDEIEHRVVAPSEAAWTNSCLLVKEQERVFTGNLVALLKSGARALPFVIELVESLNCEIGACVAALTGPSGPKH